VKIYSDPGLPYPYTFREPDKPIKPGGTLSVAVNWDFSTQDTTKGAGSGTIVVPNIVYNRLLGHVRGTNPLYNPFKLQLEPEIAKSWELSPDGLVHTFHLQPGVKWQNVAPLNGRPFTAADVKFTYERYQTTGVNTQYFVHVDRFEATDPETLKVTMKQPTADFLIPLGSFYTTLHPRELVEDGSIDATAVGTGPMIVKEMLPGQSIRFEKNPDYWEREVLLDGAELKIMLDASARLAAFRAEQVDYSNGIFNRLIEVNAILDTNPDVQINIGAQTRGTVMALIMDNPKWQDERVRRAIALAIDTEALKTILYEGMAKKLPAFDWSFLFDEEPTVESGVFGDWWRYDPDEAQSLLSAAGQEQLEFTDEYYPYTPQNTQQSEMLVDQFRKVGITMKSSLQEYTTFNSQWVGRKLKEASSVGWAAGGYDADNYFYNHVRTDAPGNRWKISDPDIDRWADEQQVELNADKRKELLRKIWDKDLDMMYRPPLVSPLSFEVYQPWLRALRYDGLGANGFYYSLGDQIAGVWLDK
jgi:peptide/nickel transport system substrate-binding protein